MTTRRLLILLTTTASLGLATPAVAQDTVVGGYGNQAEQTQGPLGGVQGTTEDSPAPAAGDAPSASAPVATPAATTDEGSLPFTGLDARWLLVGGVLLAAIGVATRRLSLRSDA